MKQRDDGGRAQAIARLTDGTLVRADVIFITGPDVPDALDHFAQHLVRRGIGKQARGDTQEQDQGRRQFADALLLHTEVLYNRFDCGLGYDLSLIHI